MRWPAIRGGKRRKGGDADRAPGKTCGCAHCRPRAAPPKPKGGKRPAAPADAYEAGARAELEAIAAWLEAEAQTNLYGAAIAIAQGIAHDVRRELHARYRRRRS